MSSIALPSISEALPAVSFNKLVQLQDFISYIKLHIQGNLIVAAASGMKFLSRVSDPVNQISLYKTVDIFIFIRNLKCSIFYICPDTLKSLL